MKRALLLLFFLLTACDPMASTRTDTGTDPDGGHDGSADSGLQPLAVSFENMPTTADGPWATWGYMVVHIDDSTAIVLGGTDGDSFGGQTFDTVWRVTVGEAGMSATAIEASGPAPRYCGCAAYDRARDTIVMYGGRTLSETFPRPATTWELALGTETWTEHTQTDSPEETLGCAMAYAEEAQQVYMFAGSGPSGPVEGTFRYDGGTWTRLAASGPSARYDPAFVSARDGESLLLFGGSYLATGTAFFADIWRFDPSDETWTEIEMADAPPGRRTPWVVVDPDREGVYAGFGYDGTMSALGDLHYADLNTGMWSAIDIPFGEGPVRRGFAAALPGGEGALGAIFGGFSVAPVNDAWRLTR